MRRCSKRFAADSVDFGLGGGSGMAFAAKGSPALAVGSLCRRAARYVCVFVAANSPIRTRG